jgi:hypothetical protein
MSSVAFDDALANRTEPTDAAAADREVTPDGIRTSARHREAVA